MNKTIDAQDAIELVLAQMRLLGIDPGQLAAHADQNPSAVGAVTMGEFIVETVMPSLKKGQRQAYKPYAKLVIEGLPKLCACFCSKCLQSFKGDSSWSPCACVVAGVCGCRLADLTEGEVTAQSCLEECSGLGDRPFGSVLFGDWAALSTWAQMRAQKRTAVRNINRSDAGRPTFEHDGRSAAELLCAFGNQVNKFAAANQLRGAQRHLLEDLTVKGRPAIVARSYSVEQLEELWDALFTSGSDDADLDMVLFWILLETGARRGGPISSTIGDLLFTSGSIRLSEKNGKVDEQPVTRELLQVLLTHALQRGDVLISKPDDLEIHEITIDHVTSRVVRLRTGQPILYYSHWKPLKKEVILPDGTRTTTRVHDDNGQPVFVPHPVGRKRYETLWNRLKRDLPWLDEFHGRPHDLRKSMGTFVERAFGHAVAQAWLRHKIVGTTEGYTAAIRSEVKEAHTWLVGGDPSEV